MKPTGLSSKRIVELYKLLHERLSEKLRSPPKKRETKKKSPKKESPKKESPEKQTRKRKAVSSIKESSGGFIKYRRSSRIRNRKTKKN